MRSSCIPNSMKCKRALIIACNTVVRGLVEAATARADDLDPGAIQKYYNNNYSA